MILNGIGFIHNSASPEGAGFMPAIGDDFITAVGTGYDAEIVNQNLGKPIAILAALLLLANA